MYRRSATLALCAAAVAAANVAFIDLVQLHGPDGQLVFVNPEKISTLREPGELALGTSHFPRGTRCVVVTSNGKYVPVQETCAMVRSMVTAR